MNILTKLLAWFIRGYIENKEQAARRSGYQEATQKNAKRLDENQKTISALNDQLVKLENERTWIIRDDRAAISVVADTSIYGPKCLPVTDELQRNMRDTVAGLVDEGKLSMPTEEQWAMILNDHPATCVVAGAGSGKSTTLVLRVIFMVCYLDIPFSKITVVSFTRKSCQELREKLTEKLLLKPWNERLGGVDRKSIEGITDNLVRTFHSALCRMANKFFTDVQWFEFIDQKPEEENDIDNPVGMVKLSDRQTELLKSAYITCYQQDTKFKNHIQKMMEIEANKSAYREVAEDDSKKYGIKRIQEASERDHELVSLVNQRFAKTVKQSNIQWPLEDIDLTPVPIPNLGVSNVFYANGFIKSTKRPILLSLNGKFGRSNFLFDKDEKRNDGDIPISGELKVRRNILKTYYGGNAMDIRDPKDIRRLDIETKRGTASSEAPRFQLQLDGELSPADILQAFYDQGSFIESLGIEVPKTLSGCSFKEASLEYHFSSALALFWKRFEQQLDDHDIMTFNRAFILVANSEDEKLRQINSSVFAPFTHLLIDEFQDISPQIVGWIKRIQSYISTRNGNPTIEAIGDDWQSIYGWRGSAPQIFIEFHKHFPVHDSLNRNKQLMMMTNFRSIDLIVSDAEKILSPIQMKISKKADCSKKAGPEDDGINLQIADPSSDEGMSTIVDAIVQQINMLKNKHNADKNHVLILARTNQVKNNVKKAVEKQLQKTFQKSDPVQFMTYHQSKGLQSEVAILCEDCFNGKSHTLRNEIYRVSQQFPENYTYDQAMEDESYRLGYVGVTRGIRRVFWFVKEAKGASKFFHES